ncbi:putative ATP-dependent RNA helicase dhr2 [Cladochytrium tenue]|nr:putative ATP-dependent RNA helicase dhr2 [Cladochytrium tenue]
MTIPGRQHPVRVFQAISQQEDYVDAAVVGAFQTHVERPPGDILVFLTGQEEIESVEKLLNDHSWELPPTAPKMLICPLFASLPAAQQLRVFEPAPPGTRKIILATNVAETSITISGIRYVIDTGMVKVRAFNPKLGIESLLVVPVSKASARQRTGRAGREAPGMCFRLYTDEGFQRLSDNTEPEILRCNLANVLLTMKASGVDDVVNFDFLDPPPRDAIIRALEHLYALKALGRDGNLTEEDPSLSKELQCTAEVLSIISMLSVESVFFSPQDKREAAGEAKRKFINHEGDHLTLLNVLQSYQAVKGDRQWCSEHFVNPRAMKNALDVRGQLVDFCETQGIPPTTSAGLEVEPVLKCFVQGFFQNVAILQPDGSYRTLVSKQLCHIHPSSVMFGKKAPLVMYHEMVQTSRQYMRSVSAVTSLWLDTAGSHYYGLRTGATVGA